MEHPTPLLAWCTRCNLRKGCRAPVLGTYSGDSPSVMVLGEAPGADEDLAGKVFIGKSGRLLRDTLEENGVDLDDCYFTNSTKCWPGKGNPTPKVVNVDACRPWLEYEIQAVKPKLIVAFGGTPLKALFGSGKAAKYKVGTGKFSKKGVEGTKEIGVEDARRREDLVYELVVSPGSSVKKQWEDGTVDFDPVVERIPVIACYHPAAALRSPRMRAGFVRDCERVAEYLGVKQGVDQTRDYKLITDFGEGPDLAADVLALDTEYDDRGMYCYSYSTNEAQGRVVITRSADRKARNWLDDLIYCAKAIILHNAKADIPQLCNYLGWEIKDWPWDRTHDSIVQAYLLGKAPLALKDLAQNELGLKVTRLEDVRGTGEKTLPFEEVDQEKLVWYSAADADLTRRLYLRFKDELEGLSNAS
jgi:uracil-DNA glycosylase family 4